MEIRIETFTDDVLGFDADWLQISGALNVRSEALLECFAWARFILGEASLPYDFGNFFSFKKKPFEISFKWLLTLLSRDASCNFICIEAYLQ